MALSAEPRPVFEGHFLCETTTTAPTTCDYRCDLGECVAAGQFADHSPDVVEYVVDVRLAEPGCCFDLDGDGQIDNALGAGLDLGVSLLGDSPDIDGITIAPVVQTGRLVIAMTLETKDGETTLGLIPCSPNMDPSAFQYPPTPPVFMVPRATAYVAGSTAARSRVRVVADGSSWVAAGDVLRVDLPVGLRISMPFIIRGLTLRLSPTSTGSELRLGGHLLLSELLSTMNDAFAAGGDCECMGLEGPLMGLVEANPEKFEAVPGLPISSEDCASDSYCSEFAIFAATGLLADVFAPDLDLNGDGVRDAISVGAVFRTLPGELLLPE